MSKEIIKQRLSIIDHANLLKNTLLQLAVVWLVGTMIAFSFYDQLFALVLRPLEVIGKANTLLILKPVDSFMIMFKVSGIAGIIITLPILLIILWRFLAPAFENEEKKFVLGYVLSILLLSCIGIFYGYYQIIPSSLDFLLGLNPSGTTTSLTLIDYLDFLVFLLAAMVVIFQTPILVFSLIITGLVKPQFFSEKRKHIYLSIVTILAILTPTPDVVTLGLIALPVIFLFEVSVLLSRILKNLPKPKN